MPENTSKKLFLLDAYALIFRAYYAFIKNPRITSKGMNTSAIFGFLLALEEILTKQKPTHIAVVFDHPSPTFRHEMYSEYKANRNETPEDIRNAIPHIKRLLEAYNIAVLDCPGFEADDIIGTLAKKATEKDYTTYMMTPDKDYAQLVSENVFILKPSRSGNESVVWGVADVKREFQVNSPEQVIDVLALMGDSSDNIPGAPGIGPKTAMKLISEFGSIEELFMNTGKVKGKCREIIESYKEQIEFSKKLVIIDQNAPVAFNEEIFTYRPPDPDKLRDLFDELEFKSLTARVLGGVKAEAKPAEPVLAPVDNLQGSLFGDDAAVTPAAKYLTINDVVHNYRIVEDTELEEFAGTLSSLKEFCFDTETTSVDPLNAELVALSFCWEKSTGYLVHFPKEREETIRRLSVLKGVFENPDIRKTGQNLKFDLQVLQNYDIDVKGPLFDTMIAHYLIEPEMRHNMNLLSELYLGYSPIHIEALIGEKGPAKKNMRDVHV
ncbi:MAG TPA: 5'-3' exonuclease H3TH domain-containing protein, partial [Bacteroidales bacterium]|nr:5'-3' exonuclease H3TH domain-containing protein [Bacteroidales bacterium]